MRTLLSRAREATHRQKANRISTGVRTDVGDLPQGQLGAGTHVNEENQLEFLENNNNN